MKRPWQNSLRKQGMQRLRWESGILVKEWYISRGIEALIITWGFRTVTIWEMGLPLPVPQTSFRKRKRLRNPLPS